MMNKTKECQCLRALPNGVTVSVRFSQQETVGLKDKLRDILTSAYEERFQRILSQGEKTTLSR